MDIFWHQQFADAWLDSGRRGRQPHAVLLSGPAGTGKRAAAAWIAATRLGIGAPGGCPQYPFERPAHADLHRVEPPEDKQGILIDQVRALVGDLALTSYSGRGKVAIIDPANTMTANAANSLLKTLEEPPGDALLVLVTDRIGRLPATVFSRCQRVAFAPPAEAAALEWLDRIQPGASWAEALRVAGNGPIAAIAALEQLDTTRAMGRDFAAVGLGRASPLDIAAQWSSLEPSMVLDWLARQLRLAALTQAGGPDRAAGLAIDESVLNRMDRRNLFCYLDTINRLRSQPRGSYNVQLTLEGLLIDWAEGLAHADREMHPAGIGMVAAEG